MKRRISPLACAALLLAALPLFPATAFAARLVFLEKFGYPT